MRAFSSRAGGVEFRLAHTERMPSWNTDISWNIHETWPSEIAECSKPSQTTADVTAPSGEDVHANQAKYQIHTRARAIVFALSLASGSMQNNGNSNTSFANITIIVYAV